MIWNLKISLPLLNLIIDNDSTRNSEHKLYYNILYIWLKLKPGSLPLAIELHQPGIHFYHVLKKHHLTDIREFKSLLDKDPNLLVDFCFVFNYIILMSNAIGKLKRA